MTRLNLKQRARQLWQALLHLHATPDQIAAGFAIGVFVSFLPIVPFRTVTAVGLAWLFRQNVVAALTGKSITLLYALVTPLVWLAEYRLGKLLVTVEHAEKFDRAHLGKILHMGWEAFAATMVGALILAVPISLAAFFVVRQLAIKWARRKTGSTEA